MWWPYWSLEGGASAEVSVLIVQSTHRCRVVWTCRPIRKVSSNGVNCIVFGELEETVSGLKSQGQGVPSILEQKYSMGCCENPPPLCALHAEYRDPGRRRVRPSLYSSIKLRAGSRNHGRWEETWPRSNPPLLNRRKTTGPVIDHNRSCDRPSLSLASCSARGR